MKQEIRVEPRPIDANELIECTANFRCGLHGVRREAVEKIFEYINAAPTLDYAPVRHGFWWYGEEYAGVHEVECSICGEAEKEYHDYCPNCGAKMDGGKKDG